MCPGEFAGELRPVGITDPGQEIKQVSKKKGGGWEEKRKEKKQLAVGLGQASHDTREEGVKTKPPRPNLQN